MDFAQRHPQRCLTIRHEQMIAEPERLFAEILEFVSAPYEDAPAEFYRSKRINSSFPELYKQPGTAQIAFDPWPEWDLQQKTTFLAEAGRTMVQYSLITQGELDQLAAETQGAVDATDNLQAPARSSLDLRKLETDQPDGGSQGSGAGQGSEEAAV